MTHSLISLKKGGHILKVTKEGVVKGVMKTISVWNSYLG